MKVYVVVAIYDEDYGDMYCEESGNLGVYTNKEVAENIAKQYLQTHNLYYSAEINVFELDGGKVESYEIESDGRVIKNE